MTQTTITFEEVKHFQSAMSVLEKWGASHLFHRLIQEGLFKTPGDISHVEDIQQYLQALPKHARFIESFLDIICDYGYLTQIHPKIYEYATPLQEDEGSVHTLQQIIQQYPVIEPSARFLHQTLGAYFSLMRGENNFLNIMFPSGEVNIIEALYKHNPDAVFFNQLVKAQIQFFLDQEGAQPQQVNILEIGAGIGSTSEHVLPMLSSTSRCALYHYTDVSKVFTRYGEKCFGETYPFLSFKSFDIQQSPSCQDMHPEGYDIIIATNVLHVAKDIRMTLSNITQLLKPNGMLVINEGIKKGRFATLVYGLTDGWWTFDDPDYRIPGSPFLSVNQWKELLKDHGYQNIISMNERLQPDIPMIQDVISARR